MPKLHTDHVVKALRAFGLTFPGAHTKSPWPGHLDLAVKEKTFAFLSVEGEPFSLSCKLPHSADAALLLPFAEPAAWGLGRSGWVTAQFTGREKPPSEVLKSWIDESYRALAPKKLLATLAADGGGDGSPERRKRAPARKRAVVSRKKSAARSVRKSSKVRRAG
jgi:hypothetical protein